MLFHHRHGWWRYSIEKLRLFPLFARLEHGANLVEAARRDVFQDRHEIQPHPFPRTLQQGQDRMARFLAAIVLADRIEGAKNVFPRLDAAPGRRSRGCVAPFNVRRGVRFRRLGFGLRIERLHRPPDLAERVNSVGSFGTTFVNTFLVTGNEYNIKEIEAM